MRYNALFAEIATEQSLSSASQADIPDLLRSAVRDGWVKDEGGAWLLRRFRNGYSGSRAAFTDLTGYEAAVNGRGVPDLDLTTDGIERARDLAKRAYAFACMALFRLNETPDHPSATAYISINTVEMDDGDICAASVTIVTHHDEEPPYIDSIDKVTSSAVLMVESFDCMDPLADGQEKPG